MRKVINFLLTLNFYARGAKLGLKNLINFNPWIKFKSRLKRFSVFLSKN